MFAKQSADVKVQFVLPNFFSLQRTKVCCRLKNNMYQNLYHNLSYVHVCLINITKFKIHLCILFLVFLIFAAIYDRMKILRFSVLLVDYCRSFKHPKSCQIKFLWVRNPVMSHFTSWIHFYKWVCWPIQIAECEILRFFQEFYIALKQFTFLIVIPVCTF